MKTQPIRMLIADRETLIARRIKEFLAENGIECEVITNGKQVKATLMTWMPDFVLMDLLLPDCPAIEVLETIRTTPILAAKEIKVLVTSSHNSPKNVKQVFAAGACDYIVKPFKVDDVLSRIVFHMQRRNPVAHSEEADINGLKGSSLYLHLLELIVREAASQKNPREKLFHLMQMLALSMKAVRCSVIRVDMQELKGRVIASSDDIRVKDIVIDLNKYPEVTHTVNTEKVTAIENLDFNPELSRLKKIVKSISFNSIIVAPVFHEQEVFGVVSARMDSKTQKFTDIQVRFCQLLADISAMIINGTDFMGFFEEEKEAIAATKAAKKTGEAA